MPSQFPNPFVHLMSGVKLGVRPTVVAGLTSRTEVAWKDSVTTKENGARSHPASSSVSGSMSRSTDFLAKTREGFSAAISGEATSVLRSAGVINGECLRDGERWLCTSDLSLRLMSTPEFRCLLGVVLV